MVADRHIIPDPRPERLVTISVTQDDIDHGCIGDPENCPEARAINRVLKPWLTARVSDYMARIYQVNPEANDLLPDDDNADFYRVGFAMNPPAARRFIDLFDHALTVEPFTYELKLPVDVLRDN